MTKEIIYTAILSFLVAVLVAVGAYNLIPFDITPLGGDMLGASVTTINGSDKIKDSRAVINSNFANLNADKLEISTFNATTSLPQITSLANLSTVGTITTGTWNANVLSVAYGGTGRSTLTQNGVLYGNGTTGILATPQGTDGQILGVSSGVPTWQSATIDETLAYDWTGTSTFSGTVLGLSNGIFGDGNDGASTTAGNYTLTRDMYFDSLTINSGVILKTAGFKLFVKGTLTVNGTIQFNGNNGANGSNSADNSSAGGAGGAGGTATAISTYSVFTNLAGVAGGAGKNTGQAGSPVVTNATAYDGYVTQNGVAGAVGGLSNGGSGAQCSQVAGSAANTTMVKYLGSAYDIVAQINTLKTVADNAGATGGCAANHDTRSVLGSGGGGGGGAGASGGNIVIFAEKIIIGATGSIEAKGGNGGNGGNSGNATGNYTGLQICSTGGGGAGGAGGNGGYITLVYSYLENSGSIVTTGGAGGTFGTAGVSSCTGGVPNVNGTSGNTGNNGSSGSIRYFNVN